MVRRRDEAETVLMKTIPLTQGKEALVSNKDYGYLQRWHWCAGRYRNGLFYAVAHDYRNGRRVTVYMHRLIARRKGIALRWKVDHVDQNGLNNQRRNLRAATTRQNRVNCRLSRNNTSGFRGVGHDGRRDWRARIRVNNELIVLGRFRSRRRAAREYNKAALKYGGRHACLNPV
jgi:hypothetical protein